MPIVCLDMFTATAAPVTIPGLAYPNVAVEGVSIQRFAMYNNIVYAEYIWVDRPDLFTEFIPAAPISKVDVYAIGQGRTGSAGGTATAGAGGSAGVQAVTKNYSLLASDYICYFTESSTIFYNPGGNNVVVAMSGAFTGTYYLYGDTKYPVGTAAAAQAGGTYIPGKGSNGCTFLPDIRAASTVYPSSSSAVSLSAGALGIGAGGTGGARTNLQTAAMSGLTGAGLGGCAMIMLRIPIG
ncbi:hypothetical protein AGMMS49992_11980 [Clostridia bacterium]|nr:hypothetical protein AGMMS49992_11980 [Clostridia bacterium]